MSRKIIILLGIFILSRIIFINPLPVFFDSPEYLARFANPNFIQALISGHMPFHIGYVGLFWPIYQIARYFHVNPSLAVIYTQAIFSAFVIYSFYLFIAIISNKKIALIAAITASLAPVFWITNVTIMAESTYVNFFLLSLYFAAKYIKTRNRRNIYFLFAGITLGLSWLTNPLVLLWLPLLFFVAYFLKIKRPYLLSIFIFSGITAAILVNSLIISKALHIGFLSGINQYVFGEDIKIAPNISSLLTALRFVRNAFVSILQNNTGIILMISIISLIKLFNENKKAFILGLLWISPTLLTGQWFDSLLYGRHGTIAVFGFAFISAIFLEKRKILTYFAIAYILLVSLPALNLLKQPIPYIEMGKFAKTLPEGLLIDTHFARPQIEGHYSGEITYVNQPGWSPEELTKKIDSYLNVKGPVYITSQALSDPYGVYSGPFLYPLSLSYAKDFELKNIAPMYLIKKHAAIDGNAGLIIYKIVSKQKSKYPNIPKLNYSRRRMDYFDPITQSWLFIERAMITQSHSIINE